MKNNNNTLIIAVVALVAVVFLTKKTEAQKNDTASGWAGQAQGFAGAMATAAQSAANTTSQLFGDIRGAFQQRRDNDLRELKANSDIINNMYANNQLFNSYF